MILVHFIFCVKKRIRSLGFLLSYFLFHCTFKTAHKLFISNLLPFPTLTFWSSPRPISSSQLHALQHFHPCPINLVVFKGSYFFRMGYLILRGASRLDAFSVIPSRHGYPAVALIANRYTRGQSIPVLSY